MYLSEPPRVFVYYRQRAEHDIPVGQYASDLDHGRVPFFEIIYHLLAVSLHAELECLASYIIKYSHSVTTVIELT